MKRVVQVCAAMAVCLTAGYLVAADAAAQPRLSGPRDSAILKLAADGSQLVWGTLLGGGGKDDAIMEANTDQTARLGSDPR